MMLLRKLLFYVHFGLVFHVVICFKDTVVPRFEDSLNNLTVSFGREAVFTCVVNDLGAYRVAWLRVDTQTILTIATHVITKNHRISVTHSDRRVWFLHIHDVRQSDRGWYMCQLNTDPMKSQTAYLDVVVPPDILDYPTSSDQVAREGANVTLRCAAHGVPTPTVVWRRELAADVLPTTNFSDTQNSSVNGAVLHLVKVSRLHMGPYLCIASNGVPPTVSKRVMLVVHFPPIMTIQNQLVGAKEGDSVHLDCHSEAFPRSINYWTINDQIISQSDKRFEITSVERGYEVDMKLKIKKVGRSTFGTYSCISKNSLGDTDGTIKLYSLSGKFEEMQYNDVDFDEPPDVSELEALKRSAGAQAALSLALLAMPLAIL
ncbi:lachesin isoform X2 [Amyelois transitella]|uniref:lachesin isoform X2 n=1 Tax=Amyelois transitella TaxID=680683 RepID=UPI0029904F6E|nr:lachesin isoform X2 [Amyelois transitella]